MEKNIGMNIIDSKDWECVIEVEFHIKIQTKLNQWRHEYDMIILACTPVDERRTYLSLMRKRREQ
jgi:hypothetical protein